MARAKLATDRLLECVCVCVYVCMCVYLCMCLCVCVCMCVWGEALFFSEESGRPLKHIAKRSCRSHCQQTEGKPQAFRGSPL